MTPVRDTAVLLRGQGVPGAPGVPGVPVSSDSGCTLCGSARAVACIDLALLDGLGVVVIIVIEQALGLGLEDPQRPAAATGELRQLLRAEEEHEDADDDQQFGCTEAEDEGNDEPMGHGGHATPST